MHKKIQFLNTNYSIDSPLLTNTHILIPEKGYLKVINWCSGNDGIPVITGYEMKCDVSSKVASEAIKAFKQIVLEYEGHKYYINHSVYINNDLIFLPDGRKLKVMKWDDTQDPPIPEKFLVIESTQLVIAHEMKSNKITPVETAV
ncbi:MAG: hypothetical protein ACI9GH_000479 [Candidatus Paceibacteria bacterium]|jgi:hypothetical protein